MSDEQEQDSSPLVPIEQQTILFYGKPLVVVRLPDGRPGIVLRNLCDNLQLEPTSQVRRIKRTEAIADDLVYTLIQTDGGPQIMPTLVLRAAPFWLAGIDPKRVREEIRPEILRNPPKWQPRLLLLFLLSRSSNLFHRLMMQVWTLGATITDKWWHGSTGSMLSNPGAEASKLG